MSDFFDDKLSDNSANLLLATRCLGRATAFPHELMRHVLTALSEGSYDQVIQDLYSQKMIVAEGKEAFNISRTGRDWLAYRKIPTSVWLATLKGLVEAIPLIQATNDNEILDLMVIHSAALANTFYDQDKKIYIHLMGLSVECLIQLGRLHEAQHRLEKLQKLAGEIKDSD